MCAHKCPPHLFLYTQAHNVCVFILLCSPGCNSGVLGWAPWSWPISKEALKQLWGLESFHLQPGVHGWCARESCADTEQVGNPRAGAMIFKAMHFVKCNILRLCLQTPCFLQNVTKEIFPLMRQTVVASLTAHRRDWVIQTGSDDQWAALHIACHK